MKTSRQMFPKRSDPEHLASDVQSALDALSGCEAAVFLLGEVHHGDLGYLDDWGASRKQWETLSWLEAMARDTLEEQLGELREYREEIKGISAGMKPAPAAAE